MTPDEISHLLADVELTLQIARRFITIREKMHPDGVALFDEQIAAVGRALNSEPTESDARVALRSALTALGEDSTPIVRRVARTQIRHALDNLPPERTNHDPIR